MLLVVAFLSLLPLCLEVPFSVSCMHIGSEKSPGTFAAFKWDCVYHVHEKSSYEHPLLVVLIF